MWVNNILAYEHTGVIFPISLARFIIPYCLKFQVSAMFICGIILTALLSASGTAASDGKRGKQGHRPDFPSLQTMVKGKSNLLPTTVVDSLSFASTSNGAGEGLTYMEFFSEENCGGGVTYSTGFRAGLCLPASDYVRPPFANDDDYPDSFPFQSLKISNVTGTVTG